MPVAAVHGKKTQFTLNSEDISGWLNDVDFPAVLDTVEVSTFQPAGNAKSYIVGLKGYTVTAGGFWDTTIDGYLATIDSGGVAVAFTYAPGGYAVTGDVEYSGSALLTKNDTKGGTAAAVTVSLELQITGAVTRTVHS